MKPNLSLPIFLLAASAFIAPASAQIAITEFFPNTRIADDQGEFVELFNYSTEIVNLNGWRIKDDGIDDDLISETDLFIAPGGYLVITKNKIELEAAFFGGLSRPEIIDLPGLTLGNSGDEIILINASDEIVWSLAYPSNEPNGNAAFLSEDNFSITTWGMIHFTDDDPASGTLGYQSNAETPDPNATSTSSDPPDTASPLAGFYTIGGGGGPGPVDDEFRILSIIPGAAPGTYNITFRSESRERYTLESSTDLTEWITVEQVSGTGVTTTVTVTPAPTDPRVFYRISKEQIVVGP